MNHTFTHFHKDRFEWAFRAKKEFINRFVRLDVAKAEASITKELTIAVYGPTQVGKTTVILSLLGLKQEMLGQLSKWLRGKRKLGESSTVTVMRYERSKDYYFHVRLPNGDAKTNLTGEQLEAALQSVRSNVETQHSYSVEPVVIEIPSDYFEARKVNMNIVDLPGVESAELKEVEHVKQCIKHWLPLSEVCLLVDDATQLTAFTQYTIKDIQNWFEQLPNFRVIPTRALSLDSIRKDIDKNMITTAKDLVADYAKVLNRVLKMQLDLAKTIYPIDVGNSWNVIREKEPVLYEKMKEIMEEILHNLQNDLENLDVNELSFSRLTKLYKEAVEESKQELEENEKSLEKYKQVIKRQDFIIKQESKEAELKYKNMSSEIDINHMFSNHIGTLFKDVEPDQIKQFVKSHIEYNSGNKKASALNGYASKLQLSIETDLESKLREVKENAHNLKKSSGQHLELPDIYSIPKIHQKIDAFWFTSTYEKALYKIRDQACDWVVEMYESYNQLLTTIRNEVTEQLEQLFKKTEAFQRANDEKMQRLHKELAVYKEQQEQLEALNKEVYEMWNQDREHAAQLQGYFIKHWLLYKEELQQHFLYGDTKERWLATQYLHLLQQDGEKIIESLNYEEKNEWLQPNYLQKVNTIMQ
jgi:GTPase SAR1 family protein